MGLFILSILISQTYLHTLSKHVLQLNNFKAALLSPLYLSEIDHPLFRKETIRTDYQLNHVTYYWQDKVWYDVLQK